MYNPIVRQRVTDLQTGTDCKRNNGCIHNQKSDLLKYVHNQIQICLDASDKNLTSQADFYKPRQ